MMAVKGKAGVIVVLGSVRERAAVNFQSNQTCSKRGLKKEWHPQNYSMSGLGVFRAKGFKM